MQLKDFCLCVLLDIFSSLVFCLRWLLLFRSDASTALALGRMSSDVSHVSHFVCVSYTYMYIFYFRIFVVGCFFFFVDFPSLCTFPSRMSRARMFKWVAGAFGWLLSVANGFLISPASLSDLSTQLGQQLHC